MSEAETVEGRKSAKGHAAITRGGSALARYQEVIVGRSGLPALLYFELCMWLAAVPGALGLMLRKIFWPRLFGSCGPGVLFSSGVVLRHPHRIHLGARVVVSEGCVLDARNGARERVLTLGDDVILSNDVMLSCKDGTVTVGARTGVGPQTIVQSTNGCPVEIGADVMIGPRCYLVGGGNYNISRTDVPMREQGIRPDSGVSLANDVWLGANVTILGGVRMGNGSVAAAGAVVTTAVADYVVCGGVPAHILRSRN